MRAALAIAVVVVLIGLVACGLLYWKVKRLLTRSAESLERAAGEIGEEISSYRQRTQ